MTQTHTYSVTIRDITWTDIGDAIDSVNNLDSISGVSIQARYDTQGGTLDDGTTYSTEAVLTVSKEYDLGEGDVALDQLATALSGLSVINKSVPQLKTEIQARR